MFELNEQDTCNSVWFYVENQVHRNRVFIFYWV